MITLRPRIFSILQKMADNEQLFQDKYENRLGSQRVFFVFEN